MQRLPSSLSDRESSGYLLDMEILDYFIDMQRPDRKKNHIHFLISESEERIESQIGIQ